MEFDVLCHQHAYGCVAVNEGLDIKTVKCAFGHVYSMYERRSPDFDSKSAVIDKADHTVSISSIKNVDAPRTIKVLSVSLNELFTETLPGALQAICTL